MLQVSLSQVMSSMEDEFQWSGFESYDSEIDAQMELELLGSLLEDLF